MNYIIFDLEWNQSPDGKEHEIPLLPFEIIEIGAIKVNENQEILDEFHTIICPKHYTKLDENVKQVVQLTDEELQNGISFPEAASSFLEWCGPQPIFCTWGSMDLVELQRNLKFYHFPALSVKPFFYYDVQKLFAIFFDDEKRTRALSFAAEFFNLQEEGAFHSALADARYTAKIFQKFDLKKTKRYMEIDYFSPPKTKEDELYISFSSYAKYISRIYKTKEALLHSRSVRDAACCICQAPTSRKIDWFSNNSKSYYGLFQCKKHGYLKGKLRVKKDDRNHYFAVKTVKIISKEEALHLKKQKEELHAKKEQRANKLSANRNYS